MTEESMAAWRREYTSAGLFEDDLAQVPEVQLARWLDDAGRAGVHEPNAMVLSTVDLRGRPTSRMVLLKGLDDAGLVFFTNYGSRKGRDLADNPAACLLFPWEPLQRQVRVEGVAGRLPAQASDRYFATRPRGAQLGAWASPQSEAVPSREWLEQAHAAAAARWPEPDPVPRPPYWGGFRLVPDTVEFWQGRADRLHDRLRYRRDGAGWAVDRLAP